MCQFWSIVQPSWGTCPTPSCRPPTLSLGCALRVTDNGAGSCRPRAPPPPHGGSAVLFASHSENPRARRPREGLSVRSMVKMIPNPMIYQPAAPVPLVRRDALTFEGMFGSPRNISARSRVTHHPDFYARTSDSKVCVTCQRDLFNIFL